MLLLLLPCEDCSCYYRVLHRLCAFPFNIVAIQIILFIVCVAFDNFKQLCIIDWMLLWAAFWRWMQCIYLFRWDPINVTETLSTYTREESLILLT